MTTQIAVNEHNDIYLDASGNLALVYDIQACLQGAQQAAQAQRGEMQYHLDRGVPNFSVIWDGHPNLAQFRAAVRQELILSTDVKSVDALDVSISGDTVVYTAQIQTVFGPGVASNG